MASARLPPPGTRQLFVQFSKPLPRHAGEVEAVFTQFGRCKPVYLSPNGAVAYVTFFRTEDAHHALVALSADPKSTPPHALNMKIDPIRPTDTLMIEGIPRSFSPDRVTDLLKEKFAQFGYRWIDVNIEKNSVFINTRTVADAVNAVNTYNGRTIEGWGLEIEYHRVCPQISYYLIRTQQLRPSRRAYFASSSRRSSVQPSSPPAPVNNAPQAEKASSNMEASGHASTERSALQSSIASSAPTAVRCESANKDRESPRRDRSQSPELNEVSSSSRASRASSRSRSPAPERSRSASPADSRQHSNKSPRHASPSPERRRSTASSKRRREQDEEPSSVGSEGTMQPSGVGMHEACAGCAEIEQHIRSKHGLWTDELTKKLVKAWFSGRYAIPSDDKGAFYISIGRKNLLQQLNEFLGSAGLKEWTIRTPMYSDWFIPEVMKVAKDCDQSRPWKLRQRTSVSAYKKLLKRLYHDA